jgi:Reverse transcriptase (RNA-dependent DNA polymerase)
MVSPILSNILLDKLDQFVEPVLIPQYTRGETRKLNPHYRTLQSQTRTLFAKGQPPSALKMRKRMQKLPSIHPRDPDWRRLKYIRYADDFGLAFTGPKSEAEEIKRAVATFLREELGLKLFEEKTLITYARSQAAHFLG